MAVLIRNLTVLALCSGIWACAKWVEPDHFACDSEQDCETGEQCLSDYGGDKLCYGNCRVSADCPLSGHCDGQTTCVPGDCSNDSDCAANWTCTDYGSCEKPCSSDSTCAPFKCERMTCDLYCIVDSDCAAGARCDDGDCLF